MFFKKTLLALAGAFAAVALPAAPAGAQIEVGAEVDIGAPVEVQSFHSRLASSGRWIRIDGYDDEVWVPSGRREGWRPYSDGQWVMTEYGWTFVSDDSWGWATWHYGNWIDGGDAGWVWAPGATWAPAWVSWRYGGGYAAWAPLPPPNYRVQSYGYDSPAWVCVHDHDFNRPLSTVVISVRESSRYIQAAQPLSRPVRAGGIYVNPGPRAERVSAATGVQVRAVSARAVVGHGTRSIGGAPAAPRAPAPVATAMKSSWSRQPAPQSVPNHGANANGHPQPGSRPGAPTAKTQQAAPGARPNEPMHANPSVPSRALPPADAAEQKARAQQQVQGNQVRAQEQQRVREERPSGASPVAPPINEERGAGERAEQRVETPAEHDRVAPPAPARPSTVQRPPTVQRQTPQAPQHNSVSPQRARPQAQMQHPQSPPRPAPEQQRAEPPRAEPPRAEPPRAEPPRAEPPRAEPPRAEPPRAEPPHAEHAAPPPHEAPHEGR